MRLGFVHEFLLFDYRYCHCGEEEEDTSCQQGVNGMAMIELPNDPAMYQSVGDLWDGDEEIENTHLSSHLICGKTVGQDGVGHCQDAGPSDTDTDHGAIHGRCVIQEIERNQSDTS